MSDYPATCQWFGPWGCQRVPTTHAEHPTSGRLAVCAPCKQREESRQARERRRLAAQ